MIRMQTYLCSLYNFSCSPFNLLEGCFSSVKIVVIAFPRNILVLIVIIVFPGNSSCVVCVYPMLFWSLFSYFTFLKSWQSFVYILYCIPIHHLCVTEFSAMKQCGTRLKQKTSHLVTHLSWNFRSLLRNRNQHNQLRSPGRPKVYSVGRYMP